jgi:hypothetical protein
LQRVIAPTTLQKFALFTGELKKLPKAATTADFALLKLADVFKRAPDGPDKTAIAMKLLGKSGADLIPLLNGQPSRSASSPARPTPSAWCSTTRRSPSRSSSTTR